MNAPARRLRILELTWEYAPAMTGGLGVACAAICEGLGADPALRIVVAQPTAGGVQRRRPGLLPEPLVPEGAYSAPLEAVQLYAGAVEREFGAEPFDVVHAHDWLAFDAALRLHRASGVPVVAHVHSLAIERDERPHARIHALERQCLAEASAVIAVSRGTAGRIVESLGVDAQRVHVVHNGIELPPAAAGDDGLLGPALAQRPRRIAFVGRLMPQKGPDRFIAMARHLLRTHPDVQLSVIGEGAMRPELVEAVRQAGIGGQFTFHGFLPQEGVLAVLRRCRALVMPSRSEPFGLAALEAVAAGTPVVIARHAGVAEVVDSLTPVDADDPAAIARACARLLDDLPAAEAQRRRALAEARLHGWRQAVREIAAILHEACATTA